MAFRRTINYSGRATRSEFIWFTLFCAIGFVTLEILQSKLWGWSLKGGAEETILTSVFPFIVGLPAIALAVRRIQDIGLHPFLLAVPSVLLYASFYLGLKLARDYEHFFNPDYTGQGRPDNFLSQISSSLSQGQGYVYLAIIILLVLAPKNFALRFPLFSKPENEAA